MITSDPTPFTDDTPDFYCARCEQRIVSDLIYVKNRDEVALYHHACAARVLSGYAAFAKVERARLDSPTAARVPQEDTPDDGE